MSPLTKQTVDEWLNKVDYASLNMGNYIPSDFALQMLNFIKLVNGSIGEENKTPVVHLRMLDEITGQKQNIANLVFRGAAKTTLFFEYLAPYIAVFENIPGFGDISGMIYVSDSMDNGVKSARKNLEFRYNASPFLQKYLPRANFTDNYIEFENQRGHLLGIKMFGAKTGLRGTKIFGKRPVLAVLDDLVSDDDSKSKTAMESIKDTIYKGVNYALHPTKRKIIFNGTPFNKNDILYEAVESGGWHVNVWPVCEKFPCEEEDFVGAWEDRFPYSAIKDQYEMAVSTGKVGAFNQELMLRITSDEERLVQDREILYYSRISLLQNTEKFNFYITTDIAVSEKQSADYSVISVWAYSANGEWFWVDGIMKRQTTDKTMDDLFEFVQKYRPQTVGIEVAGQQGGFIPLFQREMMHRNVWFSFAQGKGGALGLRPVANKLIRFNMVVPQFKAGKIHFPEEARSEFCVATIIEQIRMTTGTGIKAKNDDGLDTVSMLADMNPWKPDEAVNKHMLKDGVWEIEGEYDDAPDRLNSYIV
jgi:predicted phage terminase large subunit-like protein